MSNTMHNTIRAPQTDSVTLVPVPAAVSLVLGCIPRAPRIPSDLATLEAVDPISQTLMAAGPAGVAILAKARAARIAQLISETLAAESC